MWDKRAEYLDNDVDSVKMVLDQGFGDTKLVDVRLLGVYAPGFDEPGGKECKEFIADWFVRNNQISRWGCLVTTTQIDRFEYVAVVTDLISSSNLNAEMAQFIHEKGWDKS